jgi:hypothetical protein
MQGGGSTTDQMFQALERFRQAWPKQGWSWDYRFNAVASSFHVDLSPEAERAIAVLFSELYDHRSLHRAPEHIQEVAEAVGGVRSDQRIYAAPASGRLVPYALWWPWGDEITISLRVGLAGYVGDADLKRLQDNFHSIG